MKAYEGRIFWERTSLGLKIQKYVLIRIKYDWYVQYVATVP